MSATMSSRRRESTAIPNGRVPVRNVPVLRAMPSSFRTRRVTLLLLTPATYIVRPSASTAMPSGVSPARAVEASWGAAPRRRRKMAMPSPVLPAFSLVAAANAPPASIATSPKRAPVEGADSRVVMVARSTATRRSPSVATARAAVSSTATSPAESPIAKRPNAGSRSAPRTSSAPSPKQAIKASSTPAGGGPTMVARAPPALPPIVATIDEVLPGSGGALKRPLSSIEPPPKAAHRMLAGAKVPPTTRA